MPKKERLKQALTRKKDLYLQKEESYLLFMLGTCLGIFGGLLSNIIVNMLSSEAPWVTDLLFLVSLLPIFIAFLICKRVIKKIDKRIKEIDRRITEIEESNEK